MTYDYAESDRAELRRIRRATACDHADPITTHDECLVCAELLRRAFNRMADKDLGPRDFEALLQVIRELATA